MSDNPYSRYAYKRKRRRRPVFPVVAAVVLAVVILFTANLLFGFMKIGGTGGSPGSVTLRGASIWAVHSDTFSLKDEASSLTFEIKKNGGAGLIYQSGTAWIVIENAYMTKTEAERERKQYNVSEFSVSERKITLSNKAHKDALTSVMDSFIDNFQLFSDYLNKFILNTVTATEISNAALQSYNSLQIAVKELDEIQEGAGDPFYTKVLLAANKQLLALYLLSGNAVVENFQSEIAFCVCSMIFAYIELSNH